MQPQSPLIPSPGTYIAIMDNQQHEVAETILNSFTAFIVSMTFAQFVLVPFLFYGKTAKSDISDPLANLEHQRGVHAAQFIEDLWQSMINRTLAYVFCRLFWFICSYIYTAYYEQENGNEGTSAEEENNVPSRERDAEYASDEDQSHILPKYESFADGHITSPMSAGTSTSSSSTLGLTGVDDPWYQAEIHQTALELIEEISNDCTCVVTIYYNEEETLMIGKATLIRDGGLWETCVKTRRPNDGQSTIKNEEQMSSETDARIISKYLSFLNSPPSLTVHVPVKLPANFTLPDDFLANPAKYGFDLVVKDGRVYFSADADGAMGGDQDTLTS